MKGKRNEGIGIMGIGMVVGLLSVLGIFIGVSMRNTESILASVSGVIGACFIVTFGRAVHLLGIIADATEAAAVRPAAVPQPPQFFYEVSGDVRGPVPFAHLAAMRSLTGPSRTVTGETLVCPAGQTTWQRLADLKI